MGDGRREADELVGRVRELEQLDAALSEAIARRGSLVVITGEPGIGKTALARAFVEHAGRRGASWAWGACWDGGGAPAYWPWLQIVRQLARREDAATLRAALGDRVSSIAGLMPELARMLGLTAGPVNVDPEQARFLLFDALASLLAGVAERRPLVLVFDDLHWAEPSTLLALEFVARGLPDLPILAIAAYRHSEAHARSELATALGGLARSARRLPLAGLDRDEVGQLAAARARVFGPGEPGELPASLVAAVHHASAGNPFFVDELVQLLAAQGRLHEEADPEKPLPLPLPDGVRDTIRGRLAPVGDDGLRTLRVAAVLGGGFHIRIVAAILGVSQAVILERLDAALRTGLVVALEAPGHFSFVHALVRDTLLGDLGTAEQARLHLLAAEALERLHADDLEPYAVKIAHHYLEGAAEGGATRAVDFAVRAARRAMTQFGYNEAAHLYERAIEVASGFAPDERLAWELCHGLGEALVRAGDVDGAYAALGEAIEHARRLGDPEAFADSVLARALPGYAPAVVEADAVALLEEAIARMDGDRDADGARSARADALRCRLRVQLALALFWSPDRERREQLVDEALRIARTIAATREAESWPAQRALADRTLAFALGQGFLAVWGPDTLERGLPISVEALELCERTGDAELAMQVRLWRISLLLELDDPVRADAEIEAYGETARRLGQPRLLVYVPLHRATRALIRGEFDDAERSIGEAHDRAREVRGSVAPIAADFQTFLLRRCCGTHEELEGMLRGNAGRLPAMHDWRAALALVLAESGRVEQARKELDELAEADFALIPSGTTWLPTLALLGELCAMLGDVPRARVLYELLVPFEGRNVVSIGAAYVGPLARYLGLLATTIGSDEWALGHLETARSAAARMGARPVAVLTALDGAEVLTRRDLPGDAERAAALVRSVAQEAERLAMAPAMARIEKLRSTLAPEASRPQHAVLGSRESDARLVREGDVWRLDYEGRTVRLRDIKGLRHLAVLLASPRTAIPATALAAAGGGTDADPIDMAAQRARVADLQEELAEARAFNDPERIARVREQLEAVAAELSAGSAVKGAPAERARVNVTRAIRFAIGRIAEHEPEIGRHLRAAIRTGTSCAYVPDIGSLLHWEVRG